jgi:primosomal protein N' (replication factor Y)
MADYYCCTVGEVMNIALPSGLKLESETRVVFSGVADDMVNQLSDDEYLIAEAVSIRNELTISQIQEILNKKTIFPILRCLLDKNIISIKEELIEKFKQKMVNFMELNEPYRSRPDELTKVFDTIANSEKQTKALLAFVQLCRNKNFNLPVADVCHLAGVDSSVVKALAKKEIFTIRKQNQSRIHNPSDMTSEEAMSELSHIQDASLERIQNYFSDKKPVLLHGITGSGKTRIYTELILKNMELGKQTLYLLPEIALTTHMVTRLKKSFGADVQVYHSRMNNNERVEVWNAVLIGAKIIIAARSGLFLPYSNLGLIIVDEEHDPSYKQNDPNPRYNARDGAIYLSKMSGANIILGSATPSLESYSNTLDNKYGLVSITQRHGESVLPEIKIVDLKKEYKDQRFNGVFSHTLISAIQHTLSNKEQVLLFQNRRGYSPTVHCNICGWKAECTNCDVHLTLHKSFHELRCHYCGLRARVPMECPACGNHDLLEQGFGTEKIEEEITAIFPEATIKRMDLDTTKTKLAYEEIIQNFEDRKIDILVGTQMITKGLDFDNIALVGVLNADALLRYPDLRANERAFQLLTQVSGRAGRRAKQGLVIIQTYSPEHPIIIETMHHLYDKFFIRESNERKTFRYPPYFRMIQIELLHKNAEICAHAAKVYAGNISKIIGNRIIGPSVPSIGRIRGQYIQTITIKMEKDPKIVHLIKKLIMDQKEKLKQIASCKSVRVNIDVDPY